MLDQGLGRAKGSLKTLGDLFQNLAGQEKKKIKAETTDLEAIDIGLDFESASVKFYQDHRAKAVDPIETAFLDQMIQEEKEHWKALKDTRYYLTDPEGWFMEKERAGLDGSYRRPFLRHSNRHYRRHG